MAVDSPVPFVGRDAQLGEAWRLVARYPGCLVVVGERGTGRSRLAAEIADRIVDQGAVFVDAQTGEGDWSDRLAAGLSAAGLPADIAASATRTPFVALVGDIDEGSVADLDDAATRAARTHSLVIACATPIASAGAAVVTIEPLDDDGAGELVDVIAGDIAPVVREHVLDVGKGRPGVLVPLAQAARGLEYLDGPVMLPPDVHDYVEPLVGSLDDRLSECLVWVAVVVGPAEPDEIAALLGADGDDVADRLDELVERELLYELPPPGPPRFVVADPLVRASVVGRLRPAQRRRHYRDALAHARARDAPAVDSVALALGAADASAVVELSVQAAEDALEAHDPQRALEHADRALRWLPSHGDTRRRRDALGSRGVALHQLSRWPESIAVLRPLIVQERAAGNLPRSLELAAACFNAYAKLSDRAGAMALYDEQFIDGDLDADALPGHAALLVQAAAHLTLLGENDTVVPLATRGRDEALRCGATEVASRALSARGLARVRGSRDLGGLDDLRQARSEALEQGSLLAAALAINNEVAALQGLGRPAEALALAEEGQTLARQLGSPEFVLILATNRGESLTNLGRLGDARRELQRAVRGWRRLIPDGLVPAEPYAAWLLLAEGQLDEACAAFAELWNHEGADDVRFDQRVPLAVGFALALVEMGDRERARSILSETVAAWRPSQERLEVTSVLAVAAAIATPDEQRRLGAELDAVVASDDLPAHRAFAMVGQSTIPGGEGDDEGTVPRLREAAALFDQCELRWWAAMCRLWSGRSTSTGVDGAAELRAARQAFREMGADGWRVRCEAELRARGERLSTPGPRASGDALTAREAEVLALVAVGLSTAEVAARLVVSEKTVRRHLEGVFRKLEVTSRAGAVHVARERGLLDVNATASDAEQPGRHATARELRDGAVPGERTNRVR